ncbi:hypothetical protein RFI_25347 [Reticulomyxa filosa]|uniref:60S acidic ribosomal protein P2 n=1 Tax=Reticulomyxa filosa TaxID=46433 RepID=X6MF38_RETFI|nr:hypothetical protein RFI_25347 [Reticulomyxa filosa]|eukprot:ETO12027.1 hypothetical protein RFI_25347 [Reticulomyxa filosa]
MKEVVCYLLARLGGKDKPSKEDITKILDSVGIKPDEGKLNALFEDLEKSGKNVDEAIQQGLDKLAAVPAGKNATTLMITKTNKNKGGAAVAVATGAAPAGGAAPAAEAKKDDEEEEEKESEDGMCFNLIFNIMCFICFKKNKWDYEIVFNDNSSQRFVRRWRWRQ